MRTTTTDASVALVACTTCGIAAAAAACVALMRRRRQQQYIARQVNTFTIDPKDLKSKYNFFISAYVPRPIALVSSVSGSGDVNLAPFSYSGIVNHDPGTLVFSCVDKGKGGGDTLKNIKQTREFVVHVISESYLDKANHTSGNFPEDVNEFVEADLTQLDSQLVSPPRAAEAKLAFECKLLQLIPLENETGKVTATMVIGTIVLIHAHSDILNPETQTVIPQKLRPLARLGGNTYTTLGKLTDLARPKV